MFIGALRHSWHFPRWNVPRYRTKGLLINSIRLGIEPRPGKDFFHPSTLHPPRFSSTARLAFVVVFSFSFSLSLFSSPFLSQNHRSSSLESRDPLNRAKPRFTITDSYSRPALFTSRAERRKTIETPLTVCRGKHVPFKYVGARNASTPMCPSGTGLCLGRAVRRK